MEWRIFPLDAVFFRGTEPMNAGETEVVSSLFPPTPNMMQGFVRTVALQLLDVPFDEYRAQSSGRARRAAELLGGPPPAGCREAPLGRLSLRGPFLIRERGGACERLFPAPLDLINRDTHWECQSPTTGPIVSDLGERRHLERAGAPGDFFITQTGLTAYLDEGNIPSGEVIPLAAHPEAAGHGLVFEERRVGIARVSATHATREHHLYSVLLRRTEEREGADVQGRLYPGRVGIAVRVAGLPPEIENRCAGLHRLGGEGRMVELQIAQPAAFPAVSGSGAARRLVLLTPARWDGSWLPPGFTPAADGWQATFGTGSSTVPVLVISATVGKPQPIGGFDIANWIPKPAEPCVPAGSVFFARADDGNAIAALHDSCTGAGATAGFGHFAVGRWTD